MVTIEQKLSMFSKLLHRSMNEQFTAEMEKLRSEYSVKLRKSKDETDREAEEIIRKALKRAEAEKTEISSRMRMNIKKNQMAVKEKLFGMMTDRLAGRVNSFVLSGEYGPYMASLAEKLAQICRPGGSLVIYMTGRDIENYGELLKRALIGPGRKEPMNTPAFKEADEGIIGGFIAVDEESGIRMDFSIRTLLEDNRLYMMQTLFQALETEQK